MAVGRGGTMAVIILTNSHVEGPVTGGAPLPSDLCLPDPPPVSAVWTQNLNAYSI